ncbi:MAG TPA: nucleoside-diphosphate sugar epimerase/dehydratase [Geothrix sp.]
MDHPLLRRVVKLVLDTLLAGTAWVVSAHLFSTDYHLARHVWEWMVLALVVNLVLQLTRQHYRLIGFKDAVRILGATVSMLLAGLVLGRLSPLLHAAFDLETVITASLSTGGLWALLRGAVRARHDHLLDADAPGEGRARRRTLIVGAGRAGLLVAQELKRHRELGSRIIGFIDDAKDKQGIHIQGIPVLGTSEILEQVIQDEDITQVVLAIPSASGSVIRRFTEAVRSAGVEIKTVPGIFDLLGPKTWKPELRDISIEDLLRREPVQLDQSSLSLVLEDAVVLITGGGGSIGSELARQAAAFRPSRIVLLGRGENSLWEAERSLRTLFPNQSLSLELCDIRNVARLNQVFKRWRPQVVLHAAAHKHVPYLEAHPGEAVENNILGTLNLVRAAAASGSHTFVNISTDKAVNPTNVLGATKRIAEYLVMREAALAPEGCRYVSVRFGNVLGSRGSVIPIFSEQIRNGGPITVTHPEMTRYFMTIPEASQLVLQAGILGENARVYVLDMGEPVRILDLATDMARLSGLIPGQDLEITFSGIRPGEKLFEELFSAEEESLSDIHPKVFNAVPDEVDGALLEEGLIALEHASQLGDGLRQVEILRWLKRLVPTYAPSPTGLGLYGEGVRARRGASGSHAVFLPLSGS